MPMRAMFGAAAVVVALAAPGPLSAQSFPSRPVTMIVPFPAGGPVDVQSRVLAERMKTTLGQPVIIENVAGAAGSLGTGLVARAAGDGYTLAIGPGSTPMSSTARSTTWLTTW
jgi:tripartite-type tricarboxylate transporter receptor subunit TctC